MNASISSGGQRAGRRGAIVTGSDSGIGRATAIALAEAGFDVGVTWRSDEDGAKGTAAEVERAGGRAVVTRLDLAEPVAAGEVIDGLADELGRLDVLVNNAGTMLKKRFLDLDLDDWNRVLAVDLTGAFVCAQRAARRMVAAGHGGRIINVTSVHEHTPLIGAAPYCAAKGGLGLLTKSMAVELAQYGITVNSVAPGEIATPMNDADDDVDVDTLPRPGIPLGRPGDSREIATVIRFLASEESSYVTGASWVADGGMIVMGPIASAALQSDDWRP